MTCAFGHCYSVWDADLTARECPYCWRAYKEFCKNVPPNWRKAMGGSSNDPDFHDWREEQIIKKQLLDGTISRDEAMQQVEALKTKLRKRYCPSLADREEVRRIRAAREAAKEKTVFDTESLL